MIHASPDQVVNSARRLGVTLVELMVVLTIVALLASALLFALSAAQEAARVAKTKTMIATMDTLLMEYWEGFESRRVSVVISSASAASSLNNVAKLRLVAIRRTMRAEVPERWSDVRSTVSSAERLSIVRLMEWAYAVRPTHREKETHQGAEMLYLIISYVAGDEGAREYFSEGDIGDTDGDRMPEFLDGWGRPIAFLRWPAGFPSPRISGDAVNDHDPFDPMQVDSGAYRLAPLIYSAGPDGDYDILANKKGGFSYPKASGGWLNPYADVAYGEKMGTPYDNDGDGIEEWHDNIHNHDLERH